MIQVLKQSLHTNPLYAMVQSISGLSVKENDINGDNTDLTAGIEKLDVDVGQYKECRLFSRLAWFA
jgi:hypothetical protein